MSSFDVLAAHLRPEDVVHGLANERGIAELGQAIGVAVMFLRVLGGAAPRKVLVV